MNHTSMHALVALTVCVGLAACTAVPGANGASSSSTSSSGGGTSLPAGSGDGGVAGSSSSSGGSSGGGSTSGTSGGGDGGAATSGDGGAASSSGGADGGTIPGPAVAAVDVLGKYLPARLRSVLTTSSAPSLAILGYQGTEVDPLLLGMAPEPVDGLSVPTGLMVLDLNNGHVRLFGQDDGIPTMPYGDPEAPTAIAPVPFFDMAWQEQDHSFVAAAWTHVIRAQLALDGTPTFQSVQLQRPGTNAMASITSVEVAGGALFVGSDQGVAVLDPMTLVVRRWVEVTGPSSGRWTYGMAAADIGGPIVAVLAGNAGSLSTHVVMLRPDDATGLAVEPSNHMRPISLLGLPGKFLVGAVDPMGEPLIQSLVPVVDDIQLDPWADMAALTTSTQGTVIPGQLAWDDVGQRVLVGGSIMAGSLGGGGLLAFPVASDGTPSGAAQDGLEVRHRARGVLASMVDVLHVDALGRWWISGRKLCSETRLGQVGLYRVEHFAGDEVRVVRPLISGVRSISWDPVHQDTWLGMRDENQGLACDNYTVQQGTCRVRSDGACEMYFPRITADMEPFSPSPGPAAVVFGASDRHEMAIATRRDALWVRRDDTTRAISSQIDPGLDLFLTSAAWGAPGELWVGSEMQWQTYTGPDLDEDAINARGPHGLGFFEIGDDARQVFQRRYVRKASDLTTRQEVEGLPSNHVLDVVPLGVTRKALVALGRERRDHLWDHLPGSPSTNHIAGGLAVVEDNSVSQLLPPPGLAFEDVVALSRNPAGAILALDAALGVLAVDVPGHGTQVVHAPFWPANDVPLSLAQDAAERIAVGTRQGLYVLSPEGGVTTVFSNRAHGYVWRVRFGDGGVLYAGTDDGLVRVALEGTVLPAQPGRAAPLEVEPWDLPLGCNGEVGCVCAEQFPCASNLECACTETACACVDPAPPCQGDVGCACDANTPCNNGLECGASAMCQAPDCARNCGCATGNGCPVGWTCQGGIVGFSCVP